MGRTLMATVDHKFHDEIEIERMWLVAKQGELVFFSILPMSVILVFVHCGNASPPALVNLGHHPHGHKFIQMAILAFYHLNKAALIADIRQFKRILLFGCLLAGGWVGMGNVWFLDPSQAVIMITMSMFTLVVGVGAVMSWFSYLPAVIAVVFPATGALTALLLHRWRSNQHGFGLDVLPIVRYGCCGKPKIGENAQSRLHLSFENVALRKESEEQSLLLTKALAEAEQANAAKPVSWRQPATICASPFTP